MRSRGGEGSDGSFDPERIVPETESVVGSSTSLTCVGYAWKRTEEVEKEGRQLSGCRKGRRGSNVDSPRGRVENISEALAGNDVLAAEAPVEERGEINVGLEIAEDGRVAH